MRLPSFLASVTVSSLLIAGSLTIAQAQNAPAPKEVALTQKQIDGFVAVQTDLKGVQTKEGADPTTDPKVVAAIKKDGFADAKDYGDVSFSIGMVLSGLDPDTGDYIGMQAALKKQLAQIKADKKMSAAEKKESSQEIEESLKSASNDKPMPANIDLVKKNMEKISSSMGQQD